MADVIGDFDDAPAYAERLREERDALEYEADGVVVKLDDLGLQERLGSTGHHPRWAIAFKFPARQATTVVCAIDVQVAKPRRPRHAPFRFPAHCPVSGARTERACGEAYWRCVGSRCPAQIRERLRHFGSRRAMDIEHLGPETIEALVDRGLVHDLRAASG